MMKTDKLLEAVINQLNNNVFDFDDVHLEFPFWCIAVFTSSHLNYSKYDFMGYYTSKYKVSGEMYLGTASKVNLTNKNEINTDGHLDTALNYIKKFKTESACVKHIDKLYEEFYSYHLKPVYVEKIQDLGWQTYEE